MKVISGCISTTGPHILTAAAPAHVKATAAVTLSMGPPSLSGVPPDKAPSRSSQAHLPYLLSCPTRLRRAWTVATTSVTMAVREVIDLAVTMAAYLYSLPYRLWYVFYLYSLLPWQYGSFVHCVHTYRRIAHTSTQDAAAQDECFTDHGLSAAAQD